MVQNPQTGKAHNKIAQLIINQCAIFNLHKNIFNNKCNNFSFGFGKSP